ncbi:MAG TPA: hypothetical protein VFF68_09395 [Anaerolineaceae bacterium]|nr:hypothetical protein [Anaerolineaceae bacterium]
MRTGRLFWGIVILIIGVVLLLVNLGLLVVDIWSVIFPLFLVLLGVWFLLGPALRRGERAAKEVALDLEGATEADVEINHGAGQLQVHASTDVNRLMVGSFAGGVDTQLRREGGRALLKMSVPGDAWMSFPFTDGFRWDVGFNAQTPLRLRFHTGAGETQLDLRDLQVKDLVLETGASSTRLTFPAQAGFTRAKIETGAASLEMRIPEGVAARIEVESGMSSINIDTLRFPQRGKIYESADYETAANKIEIDIETGVGSVTVR